jgi:hypothetical protein
MPTPAINPGRIVPHGVHVAQRSLDPAYSPKINVSADTHVKDGYQAGVKAMSMTNGSGNVEGAATATITLHCTNDSHSAQPAWPLGA